MDTTATSSGLTLLELMITLAVLAILGAMMLPGLGSRLERQRLQHAAETLAGDIAEARFLAAQKGLAVYVQARAGAQWCWAVADSADCVCGSAASCQIHGVGVAHHPGVRLLDSLALRLDPAGGADAATGATFESPSGDRLRVEVSLQGRPRLCAAAGHWPQLKPC